MSTTHLDSDARTNGGAAGWHTPSSERLKMNACAFSEYPNRNPHGMRMDPEIPVLAMVSNVVEFAVAALKLKHPFLAGSTALDDMGEPHHIVLAEVVRVHAVALRDAIDKYRHVTGPHPELPGDYADPF